MKDGKMPSGDLPSKMEQTEMDLVNKQITDQLIKRQQDNSYQNARNGEITS